MSVEVDPILIEKAVELARTLQERATELQTAAERRQQAELDRMLQTPRDMATLVQMTDQAFRSRTPDAHRRSIHAHSRRAGHPALSSVRSIARCCSGFNRSAAGCPASRCRWSRNTCSTKRRTSVLPGENGIADRAPQCAHGGEGCA